MHFRRTIFLLTAGSVLFVAGCGDQQPAGSRTGSGSARPDAATSTTLVIGLMPKLVGIDYFTAVEKGAQEAATELGVTVSYDGPIEGDTAKQSEMLDTWIARKMDVIAISPNDPKAIAPALVKAQKKGIKVITFDADAVPEARSYFVNQATNESVGTGLVDVVGEQIRGQGEVAIITGSLTAANQNAWIDAMKTHMAAKYPGMKLVDTRPSEVDPELAYRVTQDLLKAYPNLRGIFAITSIALPQAAHAVKDAGVADKVIVTGLATPGAMKPYVDDGTVKTFLLWSPLDLGYLTVYTARELAQNGKLGKTLKAGRLGDMEVSGTEVLLGPPTRFDKNNIAKFNF
ncbi:MAG: autoinducer 2 ABC transporter substrate-binding protein [Candidatus Sumerlaeaceae bacterium]